MSSSMSLTEVLQKIADESEDKKTNLGSLVEQLEDRGFGPLLMLPAIIGLLPTGAIPGIPSVCGLLIFLISIQVVVGRSHPWLPEKLKKISISTDKLEAAVEKAKPYSEYVDQYLQPRLGFLQHRPVKRLVALACGVTGLMMIPLELIPLAAAVPAAAVLLASAGWATRDGFAVLLAFVLQAVTVWVLVTQVM